ncbi:MAG: hypothetical protein Fur0041_16030 [Bacteroidia bacterium]
MRVYLLAVLSLVFFASCGNTEKPEQPAPPSAFRENMLKLKQAGLLVKFSESQFDSLEKIFGSDPNGLNELLRSSGDMLYFDVNTKNKSVFEVYASVVNAINNTYPDLKSDEYQFSFLPELPGGEDTGWVLMRLRFADKWYERKLYYMDNWQIDNFVYRAYNTYLADKGINERLYLAEFKCVNCRDSADDFIGDIDVNRFGVIRLKPEQAKQITGIEPVFGFGFDDEFLVYTSAKVDDELSKFEQTGLIGKNDQKWFGLIKEDIRRNSIYTQEDVYDFLDTLFASIDFDTLNEFNPYEEMLAYMSDISRGKFIPEETGDEPSTDPALHFVRFTLKGKTYEFNYRQNNGMLEPKLINDINAALEEQKAGGAFYSILFREKMCMLIFIEDSKLEQVKKSGFFCTLEKGSPAYLMNLYNGKPAL